MILLAISISCCKRVVNYLKASVYELLINDKKVYSQFILTTHYCIFLNM